MPAIRVLGVAITVLIIAIRVLIVTESCDNGTDDCDKGDDSCHYGTDSCDKGTDSHGRQLGGGPLQAAQHSRKESKWPTYDTSAVLLAGSGTCPLTLFWPS